MWQWLVYHNALLDTITKVEIVQIALFLALNVSEEVIQQPVLNVIPETIFIKMVVIKIAIL